MPDTDTFNSPSDPLVQLLETVVADKQLHCLWINTLSMLENVGAKKIVQSEHPSRVTESVLKHAAEETRHAYFLKRQLGKLEKNACPTYQSSYILIPWKTRGYINLLDTGISRLLKDRLSLTGHELNRHAYILVTYAIEMRADDLYRKYDTVLRMFGSPVSVRGILAEEEQHLEEMEQGIAETFRNPDEWKQWSLNIESDLYAGWFRELEKRISPALTNLNAVNREQYAGVLSM